MEQLYDLGLEASRWLQANLPQLRGFMVFVSRLGEADFYLAFLPIFFWVVDKRLGKRYAYIFLISLALMALFKHAFRGPRPFWLDPAVGLSSGEGYGVPSGHTILATSGYLFVAAWFRRAWLWLLAVFTVIVMGLSRIYLGVHFVHDVLAGYLIALVVLVGYVVWDRYAQKSFSQRILGFRLMVAVAVPSVAALLYVAVRLLIGRPDLSVAWSAFIPEAELIGVEDMTTAVATLLGAGIGLVFEGSRVRSLVEGEIWRRIVRYLVGIVVAFVIWNGLGSIFPRLPLWQAVPLRFIRYTLVALWITYYGPMLFVWLKLARAEPDPGIDLTIR